MTAGTKEIRFTRAGQAAPLWAGAAACLTAALALVLLRWLPGAPEEGPPAAWALLPALSTWILARLAIHCTRHAYLILTPLGLEIFPLLRPATRMQLVAWQQIDHVECIDSRLTLHFNREKSSGVHLSLRPLRRDQRALLTLALAGRCGDTTPKTNEESHRD
jgi:hypothetical protein